MQLCVSDSAKHCNSVPAVLPPGQPCSAHSCLQGRCTEAKKPKPSSHFKQQAPFKAKLYYPIEYSRYSFPPVPVPWHYPCHSSEK